jgi:hypothetical protein
VIWNRVTKRDYGVFADMMMIIRFGRLAVLARLKRKPLDHRSHNHRDLGPRRLDRHRDRGRSSPRHARPKTGFAPALVRRLLALTPEAA